MSAVGPPLKRVSRQRVSVGVSHSLLTVLETCVPHHVPPVFSIPFALEHTWLGVWAEYLGIIGINTKETSKLKQNKKHCLTVPHEKIKIVALRLRFRVGIECVRQGRAGETPSTG